jgi:hypothetical protein
MKKKKFNWKDFKEGFVLFWAGIILIFLMCALIILLIVCVLRFIKLPLYFTIPFTILFILSILFALWWSKQ